MGLEIRYTLEKGKSGTFRSIFGLRLLYVFGECKVFLAKAQAGNAAEAQAVRVSVIDVVDDSGYLSLHP